MNRPTRRVRGSMIAVGVVSAVVSMLGIALVAIAIIVAVLSDAWVWAVVLGAAGSVLAASGIVTVVIGAVMGAARRTPLPIDEDPGADQQR